MKQLRLVGLIVVLVARAVIALPVSEQTARQVAVNWYIHYAPEDTDTRGISISDMILFTSDQEVDCYVFAFNPSGFVIVSGDDAAIPVIGYSHHFPILDKIANPAVQEYFNNIQVQLEWIRAESIDNTATLPLWREVVDNEIPSQNRDRDVAPLLSTTWDQGCGYNDDCPIDGNGPCGHVWAGCAATAMAQVMKYWAHPVQGIGSHGYTHPEYGYLYADFANTTYNWASMPDDYGESDIQQLLYHCGVALEMAYSDTGSGAWVCYDTPNVATSMEVYFKYHRDIECILREDYLDAAWSSMLRYQLNAGQPMVYRGQGEGSHAFVCDGYQGTEYFHFNWGWSGNYNGYYYFNDLTPGSSDFTNWQAAVRNIRPNAPPTITVTSPNNDYGDESFNVTFNADDPDNNAEIYLYYDTNSYGYDGVCLNPGDPLYSNYDDFFEWNTFQMPEGTYWIYGTITDGQMEDQDYSPGWLEINHNTPPSITITSPNNDQCDESFTITWNDTDPDDDAIIYLYYDTNSSDFDGVCINPSNPIYEDSSDEYLWDTSQIPEGTYWVYGTISDSQDEYQDYSPGYLVIDHHYPPVLSDIPDQLIQEGSEFSPIHLDDFVSDYDDPDDLLYWEVTGNEELSVIVEDRVATVDYQNGWTGSEIVTFTVSDDYGSTASDPATFTVIADYSQVDDLQITVLDEDILLTWSPISRTFTYNVYRLPTPYSNQQIPMITISEDSLRLYNELNTHLESWYLVKSDSHLDFICSNDNNDYLVCPLQLMANSDIIDFYSYGYPNSASSNTGFEMHDTIVLFLTMDSNNQLSLVILVDAPGTGRCRAQANFSGFPNGSFLAVSNDPGECGDVQPDGTAYASWYSSFCCNDGGAFVIEDDLNSITISFQAIEELGNGLRFLTFHPFGIYELDIDQQVTLSSNR